MRHTYDHCDCRLIACVGCTDACRGAAEHRLHMLACACLTDRLDMDKWPSQSSADIPAQIRSIDIDSRTVDRICRMTSSW